MPSPLPYMMSYGLIPKILEKLQAAKRPDRFTQDFLDTKLGHSGGSARAFIPLLKRIGFLGPDGAPTSLYDQFRNTDTQSSAVAQGMKSAFSELFERNEYAYDLPRDKLTGLVVEITGGTAKDAKTRAIVGTFLGLREFADFEKNNDPGLADQSPSVGPPRFPPRRPLVPTSVSRRCRSPGVLHD